MSDWLDVIDPDNLAEGKNVVVDVDGTAIAVFKIDGEFFAIEDVCTHDGAEIASGILEGDEIICPRHDAVLCENRCGKIRSCLRRYCLFSSTH